MDKWSNREIKSKAEADAVLDDLRNAIRGGTFDRRGVEPPRDLSPLTFRQLAEIYKERHVFAKDLGIAKTTDYRLKPLVDRFGDRPIAEIRTADVEDFVADLRKPRTVNRRPNRTLTNASVNRSIELFPAHAQLGRRSRVSRSHAIPAGNGDADSEAA